MIDLGIIADDNTGASDAAGMLTECGIPTLLVLDEAALRELPVDPERFGAVVVGTRSRSVPPAEAATATTQAARFFERIGAGQVQLKYCSTFDSVAEGNIGPSLDALKVCHPPELAMIVCPSLPVNGRTLYQGNLFVHSERLDESPLRRHPLNPMTDANITRWLGQQTSHRVGLVPWQTVRRGESAIRDALRRLTVEGCSYAVVDALDDQDLDAIIGSVRHEESFSGSSGVTSAWARMFQRPPGLIRPHPAAMTSGALILSGSQSPATARQNAMALEAGCRGIALDIEALLDGRLDVGNIEAAALGVLQDGGTPLVYSPRADVTAGQRLDALRQQLGISPVEAGNRISGTLAAVARDLVASGHVKRLLVAGGETSGAVCRALEISAVEVGLPLTPGVPWCFPLDGPLDALVLKSGNFGSDDLCLRFLRHGSPGPLLQ